MKAKGGTGRGQSAALLALGLGAAAGLATVLASPELRANLAWVAGSWVRPAGDDARWQQRSGHRTDPWDRVLGGR